MSSDDIRFIPKVGQKKKVLITLDVDVLTDIDRNAEATEISRSEFIEQAVLFAIEHMEGAKSRS